MAEKKWIKKLVGLGNILRDQDKADIILVSGGFKPAALAEVSYFRNAKFSKNRFLKGVDDLEKILNGLGLYYQLNPNYPKSRNEITNFSYIAKDRKTLDKLVSADALKNIKERRRKLGFLLGYPKTAVEAFANKKIIDTQSLPPAILGKEEIKFINFRLSKNWKKELDYVKKRAEAVKRISPELYKKIALGHF